MLTQNCTNFNCNHINKILDFYHQQKTNLKLPKKISDYDDFCKQIPILRDNDLIQEVNNFLNLGLLTNCTFTTSSATSGNYKLLAQRVSRVITPTPDNYPYQLMLALAKINLFNPTDIVVNLLTAGGMSMLFDCGNRLLEMLQASVLPIGRLDANSQAAQSNYLKIMVNLSANTIFGTPSSIVQCANALQDAQLELDIKKVVFLGEMFSDEKRMYTRQFFPNMQIYGLYGQSETGIVGFHTPACSNNFYHLLTDFFFIEITEQGEILVTDLTMPLVPLFRYYVGDVGELITETCSCKNQLPTLLLKGRCDKKFNYMGNLVSYEKIKKIIVENCGKTLDMQIQLSSDTKGNDLINIILDIDEVSLKSMKDKLILVLRDVDEIEEGIQKGVGKVNVFSREQFSISDRQKLPLILDTRSVSHYKKEELVS